MQTDLSGTDVVKRFEAFTAVDSVSFDVEKGRFFSTLFLIGSEATLPINLYLQVRDGSTPVINSISFLMIVFTSVGAFARLYASIGKS